MGRLLSMVDWISKWAGKATSWFTIIVVFIVIYEIVMRYIFHRPTIWASEAMIYLCAILYVIGGAWTLLEKRHVKIDFVYNRFSPRKRAVLDVFTFFFFALYMGMMLWATSKYAWESIQLGEGSGSPWNPPVYPLKIALAAGVFLILLQGIASFIRDLRFALKGTSS
jgi:TRAP-type mannitol/chloroaromatic compound transport system permease small subunit